jgi:DNA-binding MarR family transcriptional regulator
MGWCSGGDKLDQEIFDAMSEFIAYMLQRGEKLSQRYDVPVSAIKALRRLDAPVAMKDLGQQMHCDPSFVTMIADMLEQRGLARREPSTADRRIKNLVLTPEGLELKARLERAMLGQMPWCRALDVSEKSSFLSMTRKMNVVLADGSNPQAPGERAGEVGDIPTAALPRAA